MPAKQSERPNAKAGGEQGQDYEEGIARNPRPFRERLPNMSNRNQAENRPGGYEIGFHQDRYVNTIPEIVQRGVALIFLLKLPNIA